MEIILTDKQSKIKFPAQEVLILHYYKIKADSVYYQYMYMSELNPRRFTEVCTKALKDIILKTTPSKCNNRITEHSMVILHLNNHRRIDCS